MNTRHTIRGAGDQRDVGWLAGSGKSEVDRWWLEIGCQLLEVGCWLMEGDCYLLDVVASNTVSVIRMATSAVRLLLTHQRTIPWKVSGAGVAAQRTHSWSVTTQYKISSLVTAVSTSLWLAVAGAPENSSLVRPQHLQNLLAYNICMEIQEIYMTHFRIRTVHSWYFTTEMFMRQDNIHDWQLIDRSS